MRKLFSVFTILFLINGLTIGQQGRDLIFDNFNQKDGLLSNFVKQFYQDENGIMWIATEHGLSSFDGYEFTNYRSIANTDINFQIIQINCFHDFPDFPGFLIGTINGIIQFNALKQRFQYFALEGYEIYKMYTDHLNTIWVCSDRGLYKLNPSVGKQSLKRVMTEPIYNITQDNEYNYIIASKKDILLAKEKNLEISVILSNKAARFLFIDSKNQLWYGSEPNGFGVIDYMNDTVATEYNKKNSFLQSNFFQGVIEPEKGFLYIPVRDDGLYIYDLENKTFEKHVHDVNNSRSLITNALTTIFEDSFGNIWIGTYNRGISFLDKWKKPFKHYRFNLQNGDIASNNVRSIYQDRDGQIWIGTKDGGCLTEFLINQDKFVHYCKDEQNKFSISDDYIFAICDAQPGYLWVGTYRQGLNLFNKKTGVFINYTENESSRYSLRSNAIYALETDKNYNLFIGLVGHGMEYLPFGSTKFTHFLPEPGNDNSLADYGVRDLYLKDDSLLFIATLEGLSIFNTFSSIFTSYYPDTSRSYTLPKAVINCIKEDMHGNIWLGTNRGIVLFKNDLFFTFNELDGLSSNYVIGILEDDYHNLWLTTSNGLSKFTPPNNLSKDYLIANNDKGSFMNFYEIDGLQGNSFERNAYARLTTGEFLIGGTNGFNVFHPDSIKLNRNIPKILFTELKISNKKVKIDTKGGPITKHINYTDFLELDYNKRNFSISFTAVNYSTPYKNGYKYKLEGFDKEWINIGDDRAATYTNIPFGTYTFKVLASNNDKIWTDTPKELEIKILPPFWISNWAIALYAILFMIVLFISRRIIIVRENLKKQIEITKIKAESESRMNRSKIELFTNISHELRTPLTLINLPLNEIIQLANKRNEKEFFSHLQLIKRNVNYLVKNINQILDLRKLDTGNMMMDYTNENLDLLLQETLQSFHPMFVRKNIKYSVKYAEDDHLICFDKDKLEKVFFNLISNAIKYTDSGGQVTFEINKFFSNNGDPVYNIKVSDNGLGIPNEDIPYVFDRFFQVKEHKKRVGEGTGIGLSITKAFIEMHEGEISVHSTLGEGTTFNFTIPGRQRMSEEQTVEVNNANNIIIDKHFDYKIEKDPTIKKRDETLLIIEDSEDLRTFMVHSLQEFNIIEAENGKNGLKKAIKNVPDLIISDVMMPEMNGIQMSKELKENNITSHIPIIILTAKSTMDDQLEGFHSGAFEYIVKPFSMEILKFKIDSLFNFRKEIQERLKSIKNINSIQTLDISKHDINFLKKCAKIIEDNILTKKIGIPELCEELGMSKTQLYNKMKAITDKSIGDFIREVKLNIAARMLVEERLSISEVTLNVGFSNRSHFAKCFKDYFGENPADYIKNTLEKQKRDLI